MPLGMMRFFPGKKPMKGYLFWCFVLSFQLFDSKGWPCKSIAIPKRGFMKAQPLCSATPLWQVLLLEDPGFLKSAFWNSDDPILATVLDGFGVTDRS